jgi:adenylate cyclase
MAEFKLRLQLQGDVEKTVRVNRDEFVVGRLPVCDLHLPFLEISRHHSRFMKTETGTWFIEDLGSTNGTRLNQKLLLSPQPIKNGDIVHLGSIHLKIMLTEYSQHNQVNPKISTQEIKTYGNAEELQERWIEADNLKEDETNYQTAINRLKDLVDIAKNLNSAVSIEAIFSQVQQIVFRNLPCIERLALLVDVQGSGKLQVLNAAVRDREISDPIELALDGRWISRTICQKVFTEKVAIKTADAQRDERFDQQHSISAKGIRSALAVPVWDNNLVVGVLYADACIHFNPWSQGGDEDLSFFSALGNIVASAVQRWRLIQKLRSEEAIGKD